MTVPSLPACIMMLGAHTCCLSNKLASWVIALNTLVVLCCACPLLALSTRFPNFSSLLAQSSSTDSLLIWRVVTSSYHTRMNMRISLHSNIRLGIRAILDSCSAFHQTTTCSFKWVFYRRRIWHDLAMDQVGVERCALSHIEWRQNQILGNFINILHA